MIEITPAREWEVSWDGNQDCSATVPSLLDAKLQQAGIYSLCASFLPGCAFASAINFSMAGLSLKSGWYFSRVSQA